MQNENYINRILLCKSTIWDSLKHVEAKHSGLIVFNSGFIVGLLSLYEKLTVCKHPTILLLIIPMAISLLISLWSFYPNKKKLKKNRQSNKNIHFTETLENISVDDFKAILKSEEERVEDDLADWIHKTASAGSRKYKLFRKSLWFCLVGVGAIMLVASIIIYCQIIN
jgi:Ca2+/Na+ antiporter